jgi:hypothetical protein
MIGKWLMDVLANAVVSSLLVAALAFLFRNLIVERLGRAVAHEYAARLEALRLQNERVLEALREARAERESLRGLAFSALSSVHSATLERRINAIELLWQALLNVRSAVPWYVFVVDVVGYDPKNFGSQLHPALKQANLVEALKPAMAASDPVVKVRPFVGERLFALFYAGQALLGRATSTTISSYQEGGLRRWFEEAEAHDLLSTILSPEELEQFQARRLSKLDWLIRKLEAKVMQEIERLLSGGAVAEGSISQAQRILDAAALAEPASPQRP